MRTRGKGHFRRACILILVVATLGCQTSASRLAPGADSAIPAVTARAPVELPLDDAPHDVLTEWWYYTGHLWDHEGRRYGFEFVIFQSARASLPTGYLSHFAVTDESQGVFSYSARTGQGHGIPPALNLTVDGWTLSGSAGIDRFSAATDDYQVDLTVSALKPAALHGGGLISFGPAGDSYYYSRTRMGATGRLREGGSWRDVTGQAWFDHQWGNFVVPAVGGWDWFSLQLDDGSDLMLSVLRDDRGHRAAAFGTYVGSDGVASDILPGKAEVDSTGAWASPHTGAVYPSGWRVRLQASPQSGLADLTLELAPVLLDQELAWDRLPYWEGAVRVTGTADGQTGVNGSGYVELTGYAP